MSEPTMSQRALKLLQEIRDDTSGYTFYYVEPSDKDPGEVVRWLVSLLEQRIAYRREQGLEPDDVTDPRYEREAGGDE